MRKDLKKDIKKDIKSDRQDGPQNKKRGRTGKLCGASAAGLLLTLALPFSALAYETQAVGPAREIAEREAAGGSAGMIPVDTVNTADTVNMQSAVKEAEAMKPYSKDVNALKTAREASQMIIVIGNAEDPAKGNLSWYRKNEAGVFESVLSVEAVSGMNGITADKREGDKKTPCGVYSFSMAFGMKENPGSILPYHQIKDGDHYVDDSSSRYYNRLVNERDVEKDWNSSEVLITQAPQYNYGLVLNYNEACIPGKGSAIFLHCPKRSNNTGTSGCISIPEEYMKQIVCSVDADTRIIVAAQEADLAAY